MLRTLRNDGKAAHLDCLCMIELAQSKKFFSMLRHFAQSRPIFCAFAGGLICCVLNDGEVFFYSNNFFSLLHLPVSDMAPEGVKLLLKQCLSAKSRNRPSFDDILTHVNDFKVIYFF